MDTTQCQHCKIRKVKRRVLQLCFTCYYTPELRTRYEQEVYDDQGIPSLRGGTRKQSEAEKLRKRKLRRYLRSSCEDNEEVVAYQPKSKPVPTPYLPGSLEKIEVLQERIANREELFHPEDKQYEWQEESPTEEIRLASEAS